MKEKKRIGFLSYWGFGRGLAYVTLGYCKTLKDDYDLYVLKQGTPLSPANKPEEHGEEFDAVDVNITEIPGYHADPEVFKKWITENKLDAVVFNEYNQWTEDKNNLPKMAKELGCRVYGYLVMERYRAGQENVYDRLLVPTVSFERFMRMNKARNFTYIPYSIDLNEFPKKEKEPAEKFTFFHPGGFGGVHNRKNTMLVIEAFEMLDDVDNYKLIITSQKKLAFNRELHPNIEIVNKDLTRKELIEYYYKAHAVVLPSKWETIGIPILEALASGTPVITNNVPPMNEFVRPGLNGYLCTGTMENYEGISIYGMDTDVRSLKVNMKNITNQVIYPMLARNARKVIEQIYDLETNKKFLLEFLKEDLK